MLLKTLISEFEFHCTARELSPKTITGYRKQTGYLANFLKEKHNISLLEDIRPSHIKEYLVCMKKLGRKPSYLNDLLKAFKCLFKYAFEEGYTSTLLTERVSNVQEPKVIIHPFAAQEIKNMVSYYGGHTFLEIRNKVMLMLFFDTGIRLSELTGMHTWQVKADYFLIQGKGNKERIVPKSALLGKWLIKYMAIRESYFAYKAAPDYVFLSKNGQKLTPEAIHKVLTIAGKAVGVNPLVRVSPHTCRHTFAHMQLKNGLDLYSLSRLMGHESISITQRYLEGIKNEQVLTAAKKTGVLMNL
jgi:Site-specific recombinase XerD